MDPVESLFGQGDGLGEPWSAFYNCTCKEVSQDTCYFLQNTTGLMGSWHDVHGWVINANIWGALVQYIRWCADHEVDFAYHFSKVQEGDLYYTKLAQTKLYEFGA